MNTALRAAFVLVFPVVLMLALRALQRRGLLAPELARKAFHVGGGLLGLALPWLTPDPWLMIALTVLSIGGLHALTRSKRLDESAGKVLSSVGRESAGAIAFPLSVCILFLIARGDLILYSIPILVLTFGDAVAALIGVRYGLQRYAATEGTKSVEGSSAFFLAAFFCVHVPLLLFSDTGRVESLLIALIIGLLVMMVEAIAWNGLDNLFVPLSTFVLLRRFLSLTGTELGIRLVVTAVLSVAILATRHRASLNPSGLLGACFVGYVFFFGGGVEWFGMPLIVLVAYQCLSPSSKGDREPVHDIHVVLSVCGAGLGYLLWSHVSGLQGLLLAATISFAAHLAIIGSVRWQLRTMRRPAVRIIAMTGVSSCIVFTGAWIGVSGVERLWSMDPLLIAGGVFAASSVYGAISPEVCYDGVDLKRWRWQAVAAAVGSLVGLIPGVIAEFTYGIP